MASVGADPYVQGDSYVHSETGFYGQAFDILLRAGAQVNALGGQYSNTLQAASYHGNESTVHILLAAGANINSIAGHFRNSLMAASVGGHDRIVKELLKRKADPNAKIDSSYRSPLVAASF